jgi:hypothetical protein
MNKSKYTLTVCQSHLDQPKNIESFVLLMNPGDNKPIHWADKTKPMEIKF